MKNFKKIAALLLAVVMVGSTFVGCGNNSGKEGGTTEETTVDKASMTPEQYYGVDGWEASENVLDDNYRNYYHIFVYSFADSDGDGVGDINGITSKLDYIDEMGFNGIWLSPIHQSTTYHKYDVVDYYSIDKEYGTMEDFEKFMEECEKRGIKVILDLVFNHTSAKHEWFETAASYLRDLEEGEEANLEECPYVDYYHIKKTDEVNSGAYYKISGSDYSYEGQFWDQMPDLNLASTEVRREVEEIAKFWVDKGVGGFRLDAAKEFYTGDLNKNVEVLSWFTEYCKNLDEDLYLVAEVWDSFATITEYYKSGITSIFDYAYGDSSGYIIKAIQQAGNGTAGSSLAKRFVKTQDAYYESNPNMINAPFLSNHDCGRIAGFSSQKLERMKMAGALNAFMSGSSFTYYGEELGMSGAGKDENKRAPMYWSDFGQMDGVCAGPAAMDEVKQKNGSYETQKTDKYSIYWYYRNIYHIKNMFPEIARGKVAVMEAIEDGNVCAISKTYNDETIYILFNINKEATTVNVPKDTYNYEGLVASLAVDENEVTMEGETVTLPAFGIAVIK